MRILQYTEIAGQIRRKKYSVQPVSAKVSYVGLHSLLRPVCPKFMCAQRRPQISLHIRIVWSVFVVRMTELCILGYQKCAPAKILIRLHECTGWSESLLTHIQKVRFLTLPLIWGLSNLKQNHGSLTSLCRFRSGLNIHGFYMVAYLSLKKSTNTKRNLKYRAQLFKANDVVS